MIAGFTSSGLMVGLSATTGEELDGGGPWDLSVAYEKVYKL